MKYNLSRWAIAGHDSLKLNSLTFKFFFENQNTKKILLKKKILNLWASDLRTHTRLDRWKTKINELKKLTNEKKISKHVFKNISYAQDNISYDKEKFLLKVTTKSLKLDLNLKKGLSIDSLSFKKHKFVKCLGTLKQGYFSSIKYGVDFFSGNFVSEILDRKEKYTDLNNIEPEIFSAKDYIIVVLKTNFDFGKLIKTYWINLKKEEIKLNMKFEQFKKEHSVVRPFHFTLCDLNNNAFYACKNGGSYFETYFFNKDFDQSKQVSNFISNTSGVGATDGNLILGDEKKKILFNWDQSEASLFPMIKFKKINKRKLLRVIFSCSEINDTSKKRKNNFNSTIMIRPI